MRAVRLPPLNALRAFEAAARHASFSRAADELGVTHGAVSKQIRVLEDDLGQTLFSRGVRQVKLTSSGRELMAEIAPALVRIGAVAAAMRRGPSEYTGQVRINTRPSFALRWLIPHLPRFVRAYPGIEPQVTTSTLEPARLSPSGFDIAIRRATLGRGGSAWPDGTQPRAFLREGALPVASPALLAECPVHRPEDLNVHVLLHTATRRRDWEDWLALARCSELHPWANCASSTSNSRCRRPSTAWAWRWDFRFWQAPISQTAVWRRCCRAGRNCGWHPIAMCCRRMRPRLPGSLRCGSNRKERQLARTAPSCLGRRGRRQTTRTQ
jgi:DNA-binding transcriptional LysR family regulator